jgi:hypothetical protein
MAQNGRINNQVEGHGIGGSMSGAEAFLGQVADSGIRIVFANPGTTEMWLVGALDKLGGRLRPVLCLAETVATGAADGYARMAQKPSATILHLVCPNSSANHNFLCKSRAGKSKQSLR